jgi:hypothetical protein
MPVAVASATASSTRNSQPLLIVLRPTAIAGRQLSATTAPLMADEERVAKICSARKGAREINARVRYNFRCSAEDTKLEQLRWQHCNISLPIVEQHTRSL